MKRVFIPIILWYLRLGARIQIKKTNPTIIGVGGSSGKSSLTRLIAGILKDHFVISATQEKNSETGIPLHILNIHFDFSYSKWFETLFLVPLRLLFYWPKYQFLLAEMGIDSPVEPKNMSYLLKIIQPTIGVITNITAEHSVYFDPYIKETDEKIRKKKVLEMTTEQEILLLTSLPANGVAVVNLDDESIATFSTKIKARQITISTKLSSATLFGQEILLTSEYFSMEIVYKGNAYRLVISQPLPSHFSYEFLCAVGVALSCGLSIQEAVESVEKNFSLP
ncbi:MAG TPA: Mur ligase family protein, partial [Patescibacteria group bacterium]|nr:Mur ligase family protein [Patescibacteria group bacterium]